MISLLAFNCLRIDSKRLLVERQLFIFFGNILNIFLRKFGSRDNEVVDRNISLYFDHGPNKNRSFGVGVVNQTETILAIFHSLSSISSLARS